MKKICLLLLVGFAIFATSCSSSKNATDLKATTGNLKGEWKITNIDVNLPAGFNVTNVFDEAPYSDFKNSNWELIRNGKGSFTLSSGTKQNIYWSVYNENAIPQFQFKKLDGEKPRNVAEGYRLTLQNISANSFTAISEVPLAEGKTGSITYTFTRK